MAAEPVVGVGQVLDLGLEAGDPVAVLQGLERPRLLRALEDQRIRVERYILYLCRDPEAFAALRRGPDTLLEACRARDGEAAEAATRDALVWVLAELQRMLGDMEKTAA